MDKITYMVFRLSIISITEALKTTPSAALHAISSTPLAAIFNSKINLYMPKVIKIIIFSNPNLTFIFIQHGHMHSCG